MYQIDISIWIKVTLKQRKISISLFELKWICCYKAYFAFVSNSWSLWTVLFVSNDVFYSLPLALLQSFNVGSWFAPITMHVFQVDDPPDTPKISWTFLSKSQEILFVTQREPTLRIAWNLYSWHSKIKALSNKVW